MTYSVYKITNLINNTYYIGQTKNDIKERWWHHLEKKVHGSLLKKAIAEFGKENFKIEVIEQCDSRERALKLESEYIIKFNTLYPNGYNRKAMINNRLVCEPELEKIYQEYYSINLNQTGRKRSNAKSAFRGVSPIYNKFASTFQIGGRASLGHYLTEHQAAIAFDLYALEHNQPDLINFPESKALFLSTKFKDFELKYRLKRNKTSGILGICWNKRKKKWMARYKKKFVGNYSSKEDAAKALEEYKDNLIASQI